LSPSITKGSNRIDLGKNSGVDMGRKAQPSVTSGGIGITQEVTNIAGVSVSAGANVDITPVNFGISVNPSEGTVSVSTGAEVPGGLIGISGGIEVNTNTGQIIGGSVGAEALGLGINVSSSEKGGIGIEFTVQIPGTPIELSLGFGFPPKKTPSPSPSPSPSTTSSPFNPSNISTSAGCANGYWALMILTHKDYVPQYFLLEEGLPLALQRYIVNTYNPYLKQGNVDDIQASEEQAFTAKKTDPDLKFFWENGGTEIEQYEQDFIAGKWQYFLNNRTMTNNAVYGAITIRMEAKRKLYYPVSTYTPYELRYQFGNWGSPYDHKLYLVGSTPPPPCPDGKPSTPTTSAPSPSLPSSPSPPPFPNPPPIKKMDECCRDSTKLLREIHKRLGISKFPGKLPETIIQETPKEGEQPAEPAQVPIEDFVDLLNWQFERDDERWGQWQVEIAIKDSDITKEGDQPKQIKLPNLAESIGEFQGQLLSIMTNVDALVAIQVKTLAESGMARQEAIKGYLAAKAIIKYMAFKSTEIDVTVPLTFTAGAETISDLLKESEGHIKGTDYEEKETLRDIIADLLQAAAIIRAVHWQRIDTKSDTKSQLLNILKGSVDLAAKITRPQNPNAENNEGFNPEKDFEDFIDSVEDGFRNTTGITDGQNPYGKSPDRRPRIRQIGDNVAQAGGNS
jgi:hypothetical protein